jgi:hypothetical protein
VLENVDKAQTKVRARNENVAGILIPVMLNLMKPMKTFDH